MEAFRRVMWSSRDFINDIIKILDEVTVMLRLYKEHHEDDHRFDELYAATTEAHKEVVDIYNGLTIENSHDNIYKSNEILQSLLPEMQEALTLIDTGLFYGEKDENN